MQIKKKATIQHLNGNRNAPELDAWQRQRPDLDPALRQIRMMVLSLGAYLLRDNDLIARKHGISGAEMRILFALRRSGAPFALRPTDLHKALLVPSATMTRQVDRLEASGKVTRTSDPLDRRGYLVHLTKDGRRVADLALTEAVNDSLVSGIILELGDEKQDALWLLLHELVSRLEGADRALANAP